MVSKRHFRHTDHMFVFRHMRARRSLTIRLAAGCATIAVLCGGMIGLAAPASAAPVIDAGIAPAAVGGPVKTADLSKFQAGNIISDAVFFNSGTMSADQIQSFLNGKVPSCQAGYTCLKDFTQTTQSFAASAYCNGYAGGGTESAATIIYKVAVSCGINPQVLLVTLQKEQGLVTHTWPSSWRYTIAMGQGCPDTAACDTKYYGFQNQVYGAARQFKIYAEGKYFTYYAPGKTWNILYNPNSACGSAPVYVQNKATAGLYYYTPYQPNAAALRAGYGDGDGCSAYGNRNFYNYFTDWFGSTQGNRSPFGNVEVVQAAPGVFHVAGWAIDPDSSASIAVHVYVNSVGAATTANVDRPDVGAAYSSAGSAHGFSIDVPAQGSGTASICVYGINVGQGDNALLGCSNVQAMSGSPVGAVDSLQPVEGAIQVSGWAIDPDTASPIPVHVYVDSDGTALVANGDRPDIASHYPAYGSQHGYSATVAATPGLHRVCVYAIDQGPGDNAALTCQNVTVTGAREAGRAPKGNFESLSVTGSTATVSGWALDPDTLGSVTVRISVDGVPTTATADSARADIAMAFPGYGADHGFSQSVRLPSAQAEVCVSVINTVGDNMSLGCRTATGRIANRSPVGSLDVVQAAPGVFNVSGWAADPDTTDPIPVHVYVGSTGTAFVANGDRPDVASAFARLGGQHGYSVTVPATGGGSVTVCAWGIDVNAGANTRLGCRTLTAMSGSPVGSSDAVIAGDHSITVSGWAIDPDVTGAIPVHVYLDGVGRALSADGVRPDVAAAFPAYGANHGYTTQLSAEPGNHTVCVYAINTGPGNNAQLTCQSVRVSAPPIGSFDSLTPQTTGAIASGWALDPDSNGSIAVHIYVDGVGASYAADQSRPDVAAAFPGKGADHGFSAVLSLTPGLHHVCAYGIDAEGASNSTLGCRDVTVR